MQQARHNQLEKIRHFLTMGYYDSAVKESCGLLEEILKNIYRQAMSDLPVADRAALMEAEASIGRGTKSYLEFGFGQLVALFNKSRLLDAWSKHTNKKMGMVRSISLDYIVELRNQLTHNGSAQACSANDAQLVYDCLMSWLAFIGYNDLERGVERSFAPQSAEAAAQAVPSAQPAAGHSSAAEKHTAYMQQQTESSYHSDKLSERRRLKIQSQYSEESDRESFRYALQHIGQKEHLYGLDVGCADGFVTESRFREEYGFELVLGVDHNTNLIGQKEAHGPFRYHAMDIEAPSFEDDMEALMEQYGIEGFDVIFMALTLHHLKQPKRFLRKIRQFLNKGGAIILRGVDDGALVACGDNGLVEKIIEESIETKNMSDRFHGRKFYSLLRSVGFEEVKMNYAVADTVGISAEEKSVLFRYYFKFRSDYTKRQWDTDPENPEYQRRHEQMVEDLEALEDLFLKPDFYLMVMTITAIAFR